VVTVGSSSNVQFTLGGSGTAGSALGASFAGIEGASGGQGADTLTGSTADSLLVGGNNADQLFGMAGNDFLIGKARNIDFFRAYLGIKSEFFTVNALDPLNCNASGT